MIAGMYLPSVSNNKSYLDNQTVIRVIKPIIGSDIYVEEAFSYHYRNNWVVNIRVVAQLFL